MESSNLTYDTFDACGRGGEVKFQNYNDWRFDHLLQVVDAPWQETKILDCYSRAGLSDDDWLFDFYVQKGAFYMCEKGLYRTDEQVKKGFEHAVYPSLHARSDNSVAKIISNILKKEVANKLGEDWEDLERVTSRGLRSGSVSQLSMFPNITVFQATALTGHSIGNLRSYLDQRNLVKALPAANAIHQNKSLYTESVLPTLQSISADPGSANEEVFKKLMGSMFTVSIEDFSPGGKHYIILVTCALSLIRHYRDIIKDCGAANVVTRKLVSHASNINIRHLGNPYLKPAGVIELWCDLINDDISKRKEIKDAEALKDDHKSSVVMGLMTSIATDVREQKDQSAGLVNNLATAKSIEIQLLEELEDCKAFRARLEAENASLRQKLNDSDEKMRKYRKMLEATIANTPDKIGSSEEHLSPVRKRSRLSYDEGEQDNHVEMLSDVFDGEDPAAATTTAAASVPTTTAALAEQSPAVENANPSSSSNTAHPIMVPTNSNVTATTANSNATTSTTSTAHSSEGDIRINWTNGAESASDKGKRFLDVLLELCDAGLVQPGKKLKNTAIPASILNNPSGMTHCLEVGDFCCDSADIDLVATYEEKLADNTKKVQAINAAVRIEDAIYHKVFEFKEKRPEEYTKVPGRNFLGMAKHIKEYRTRIKNAKKMDTRILLSVPLMEVEDLKRIEMGEVDPSPSATVESQIQEEEEHVLHAADAAAVSTGGVGSAVRGARGRTAGGVQRSIVSFAAPILRRTASGGPSNIPDGQVEGL